jgi:DNA-binding NtrC family response regulator
MNAPEVQATRLGPPQRILIVDDLEDARDSLKELLQISLELEADTADDGAAALAMLEAKPYSVVITDLRMPKLGGMKLIETIQEKRLPVTVIVTTAHGNIKDAVQAIRMGAYDFLTKPADPQHLCLLIQRALRERSLLDEVTALRHELGERRSFQNVISRSSRMVEVFELISQIADTTSTVLLLGETGVGKEQIARAVHQASAVYRKGPFVAVNCAALPESLLESELFGHEKGSFTGASSQRIGRFQQANGGTLFLDEIGDVPLPMQVKLLRVLQERKIERVGGTESIEIDVRVVAATHQDLHKKIADGSFREDLYYRLNVVRIDIPPLRERLEDIPMLVAYFTQRYARLGQPPLQVEPEAMQALMEFNWPGNVRQLENAIERACVTAREGLIRRTNLPPDIFRSNEPKPSGLAVDLERPLPEQLNELITTFEKRYLKKALRKTRGHVGRCAKISGLSRRSISEKIAQYQIDKEEFKK